MPCITDIDGTVFERLRPRLLALSRRIVGSAADAEDVVQDVFLKWRVAEQAALETPAAWLTTVVRRQSIDRLRRRARDAAAAQAAAWMPDAPSAPPAMPDAALVREAEVGEALARLLARLSPSERLALVLHEAFECGHADIAATLGTTAANARQLLSRARRRLRAPDGAPPPDETLCRDLVRRFHAALDGVDVPAMVSLLADLQPMAVRASRPEQGRDAGRDVGQDVGRPRACANDASYALFLAA